MKNMILAAALLLSATAQAAGDQYVPVLKCTGSDFLLLVSEGGLTGMPMVQVLRDGESQPQNYLTKREVSTRAGGPVEYKGQNITVAVNFTVAPNKNKTFPGVLTTKVKGKKLVEEMSCKKARFEQMRPN